MPVYLFWGDDDFAIAQAVKHLKTKVLDPAWSQFNYDKISGDESDAVIVALERAMTPVFGTGGRLIWLYETSLTQNCPDALLSRLQQTIKAIPETSHLLLTSSKKPDARLKVSKLLKECARVCEYSLIPPWKTTELIEQVKQIATEVGVKLTPAACELLAESVGNQTRQLWNEIEKLRLYRGDNNKSIDVDLVTKLVNATTQSSFKLAETICQGNVELALTLASDLISRNEPPLKIVATLVGQFRTWTIVKLKIEAGEKDEKAIASAAEIANPKRIFILRKQIQAISSEQFLASLPLLLELEFNLKKGIDPNFALKTQIIKLCQIFKRSHP
jgi:DNA polymerase III subunit delta